jgi:hypothetical protein
MSSQPDQAAAYLQRGVVYWSIEPSVPKVAVYADEVMKLESDVLLYGNVFLKPDEHGVNVRIAPSRVRP